MAEQRVMEKIALIEKYVADIEVICPETEESFKNDKTVQYAVERLLQVTIEAILDICAILIKEFKLGPPRDEDTMLDLLQGHLASVELIKDMKRFRNVLVHRYGYINQEIIFYSTFEVKDNVKAILDEFRRVLTSNKGPGGNRSRRR